MKLNNLEYRILELALSNVSHPRQIRVAAAAITVSEMHFRPAVWRFAEYLYAIATCALKRPIGHLTLGISQISIRHVLPRRDQQGLSAIYSLSSPRFCIELCCDLLASSDAKEIDGLIEFYNGNSSAFYRNRVKSSYAKFKNFADSLRN